MSLIDLQDFFPRNHFEFLRIITERRDSKGFQYEIEIGIQKQHVITYQVGFVTTQEVDKNQNPTGKFYNHPTKRILMILMAVGQPVSIQFIHGSGLYDEFLDWLNTDNFKDGLTEISHSLIGTEWEEEIKFDDDLQDDGP